MDKEIIKKLALLAKLKVGDSEAELYDHQLSAVLHHLDSLAGAMDLINKHGIKDDEGREANTNEVINSSLANDKVENWPEEEIAISLIEVHKNDDGLIIVPAIKS